MSGSASGPASSRQSAPLAVVKRLMQKDMWSGWGIRTLSADHPSFNPYNYQTGAVWPHDNSLIALGMRRYGFDAEAAAVARDISGAASHFLLNQLPELYAGLQRDPTGFPVQYLGANVPQAWAAGTPFMLLQAMLGLEQDAPRGKAICRSRAAGLAAGHDVDRSAAGAATVRYPVLAGRQADEIRGAPGKAQRGRAQGHLRISESRSRGWVAHLAAAREGSVACSGGQLLPHEFRFGSVRPVAALSSR